MGYGDMGMINETLSGITGCIRLIFCDVNTGAERIAEYQNVVTAVCKNMIARRLAGEANTCDITYIAVGTGAGVPGVADTILFTELERNLNTSISAGGAIVTITGFFGASEAIGVLTEVGAFGEGATAAADSGVLINHATIAETKSSSETLTVEIILTIN
ncbi:MAG: hypothetical protein Q7J73_00710 [Dehalococcoidales bacterium]|nr:hypothetical protein [Dehalococcoidales bacterium]